MNDLDLAALKSQVNALQKWMSDLAANLAALELQIMAINERVNEHEAIQTAQQQADSQMDKVQNETLGSI